MIIVSMAFSCVVCGNNLPPYHEHVPSCVDFCSLQCAEQSGATLAQITAFKALLAALTPTAPMPKP